MAEIREAYRRIGAREDRFDLRFWQDQGPEAIFEAALELVRDARILRQGYADEPAIDRGFERFLRMRD